MFSILIIVIIIYYLSSPSHVNVNFMSARIVICSLCYSHFTQNCHWEMVPWCGRKSWKLSKKQWWRTILRNFTLIELGIVSHWAHSTICFVLWDNYFTLAVGWGMDGGSSKSWWPPPGSCKEAKKIWGQ